MSPRCGEARRFLYENGLALFFGAIFLATLVGEAFAGWHNYNVDQVEHASPDLSFLRYVTSSLFGRRHENWQSEYLQFTLYIFATVWLLQRGSPESKELERRARVRRGAARRRARASALAEVGQVGGLRTPSTRTRC